MSDYIYENLACEKSISGCISMNLRSVSCFFMSSDVGRPIAFCRCIRNYS